VRVTDVATGTTLLGAVNAVSTTWQQCAVSFVIGGLGEHAKQYALEFIPQDPSIPILVDAVSTLALSTVDVAPRSGANNDPVFLRLGENPARGELRAKIRSPEGATLRVLDVEGRVRRSIEVPGSRADVWITTPSAGLEPGVYAVGVWDKSGYCRGGTRCVVLK
jgi:hypothetical protein